MRVFGKSVAAGAVSVTLVGMCLSAAGPAMADPLSTPSLTTLAGVGSDTLTPLFDNGHGTTSPGCLGNTPGTFVHDYNATGPTYKVASWSAVNTCTGVAGQTITTKALNSSDHSCSMTRPNGSSAGVAALNLNQTDTNKVNSQKVYCIDYSRSSRGPNSTSFQDAFVALARDGMAWSSPKISGVTNPEPASLTHAQLVAIYTCADTNWDQVGGKNAPIAAVLPNTGSGTHASWLTELGITASSEPCWQNGTVNINGVPTVIEENTGLSAGNKAQFTKTQAFGTTCANGCPPQDVIFPYSIGDNIAQTPLSHGVGGHATNQWGHGNLVLHKTANVAGTPEAAITTNSAGQKVINPAWNPQFLRIVNAVTRNGCFVSSKPTSTAVCLPSSTPPTGGTKYPTYEVKGLKAFLGTSGWICKNATAQADIVSYGFTKISNCGTLTAGD